MIYAAVPNESTPLSEEYVAAALTITKPAPSDRLLDAFARHLAGHDDDDDAEAPQRRP